MKKLLFLFALISLSFAGICQTGSSSFEGKVVSKAVDATIVSYKWTQVSGPNTAVIATPNAATTAVSGLAAGDYVFRFTITDNFGFVDTDDVAVKVVRDATVPVADAGPDQIIYLGKK